MSGPLGGPRGPQGPQGAQGPVGPTGSQGLQGPMGPAGADGRTFEFQGVWQPEAAYVLDDVVQYQGSSWIAVADSVGEEPDTESVFWEPIALMGATGPQGPQGPAGPTGSYIAGDGIVIVGDTISAPSPEIRGRVLADGTIAAPTNPSFTVTKLGVGEYLIDLLQPFTTDELIGHVTPIGFAAFQTACFEDLYSDYFKVLTTVGFGVADASFSFSVRPA